MRIVTSPYPWTHLLPDSLPCSLYPPLFHSLRSTHLLSSSCSICPPLYPPLLLHLSPFGPPLPLSLPSFLSSAVVLPYSLVPYVPWLLVYTIALGLDRQTRFDRHTTTTRQVRRHQWRVSREHTRRCQRLPSLSHQACIPQ